MVGSVVIPASIVPFLMAAMKVLPAPTATKCASDPLKPALPRSARVIVCVPEPMSVTPRFFPLRSAAVLIESAFLLATISASPGAMPNWQMVSIFFPLALSSTTMSFRSTDCTAAAPPPALFEVPPHAASAMATATAPPTATNARRLDPCIDRFSSLNWYFAADAMRSPLDEPLFERADEALSNEGENRQQEHAGEHAVDVEGVPRVVDQLAEAGGGPEQLPDYGADDGQPEADVEAGENPRKRGRDDDLERQAPVVGAEDAGVGDQIAVDLANALESVEEDNKEHQHDGGGRLAPERETEHDREQGAEHHARDRVRGSDKGRKGFGEQLDAAEHDPEDDAECRADDEADHGLLHRHGGLQPERPQGCPLGDPGPQPRHHAGWLAHEEGIDPVHAARQLPAAEPDDGKQQAQAIDRHQPAARGA